jgi:hypothetical protein
MANNRMWLVHKGSSKKILLAKYYPSTHWYAFHSQEKMDEFLEAVTIYANNESADSMWGPTDFTLEFEVV